MSQHPQRDWVALRRPMVSALLLFIATVFIGCGPSGRNRVELDAGTLDRYAGEYRPNPRTQVTVSRNGEHLSLKVNGAVAMLFVPESIVSFRHRESGTQIQFATNASGAVTGLVLTRDGQKSEAPRVTPSNVNVEPDSAVGSEGFRFQVSGTGMTTVVLWGGMDSWRPVQQAVAEFARVVTWNRIPHRGVSTLPVPRQPSETVQALYAALTRDLPARSFLLVGHSFSGALARVFASSHPGDVVGLVLVDPFQEGFVDWLEVHQPENHALFLAQLRQGYASDWESTRAELLAASSFPTIPVVVISANHRTPQSGNPLEQRLAPSAMAEGSEAVVAAHRQWIAGLPDGKQIFVEGSSHDIPREHPEVVVTAIRQMVERLQTPRH